MNLPQFDISIEGYNTEQVDFYIERLVNELNFATAKVDQVSAENDNLRINFLDIIRQFSENIISLETKVNANLTAVNKRLSAIEESMGIVMEEVISIDDEDVNPDSSESEDDVKSEESHEKVKKEFLGEMDILQDELEALKKMMNT